MSTKSIISKLQDCDLIRLFLEFVQTHQLHYEKTSKEISYKCYEATWILIDFKANGYGRTQSEAYKHALRNLLEVVIEEARYTEFFANTLPTLHSPPNPTANPRSSLPKKPQPLTQSSQHPSNNPSKKPSTSSKTQGHQPIEKQNRQRGESKLYESYSKGVNQKSQGKFGVGKGWGNDSYGNGNGNIGVRMVESVGGNQVGGEVQGVMGGQGGNSNSTTYNNNSNPTTYNNNTTTYNNTTNPTTYNNPSITNNPPKKCPPSSQQQPSSTLHGYSTKIDRPTTQPSCTQALSLSPSSSQQVRRAISKLSQLQEYLLSITRQNQNLRRQLIGMNSLQQHQSLSPQLQIAFCSTQQFVQKVQVLNDQQQFSTFLKHKPQVPKLKLQILPNYHKKAEKPLNQSLLAAYNQKRDQSVKKLVC